MDEGMESQDTTPAKSIYTTERQTRVERDREALSRCGAGAAGGSWDSVGGRQALVRLLGERTAPEMGGGWSLTQGKGPPGLRLTSLAFGTQGLVEGPPAVLGATEAGDLDVLDGELIVICDLLVDIDVLLGVDDNFLLGLHRDHLGVTVGVTAVINEPCKVAALGGVNDGVVVYPEHVAATDAFVLIPFLPHVCNHLADVLTHVLNDHLIGGDGLHGKQAPVVNVALTEFELFLPKLGDRREGQDG